MQKDELLKQENTELVNAPEVPMGFSDEDSDDMIIPRIKVVQSLSPERKEKTADEGDIINSLTLDNYNGKTFIPVMSFKNVILWKDRSDGGGMEAIARDNKTMVPLDGSAPYPVGKLADFDNTKTGKEALPKATRYFNFLGFFEGEHLPVILSFGKTNYNEGKKLYSLAKVTMQNMWNHGYSLNSKTMAKNGNEWYIISVSPTGATSQADREFASMLFTQFGNSITNVKYDIEEAAPDTSSAPVDVTKTEY